MPSELHEIEKNFDTNSIVIRVIFDKIDHQLHFVQLERLHLIKREKQSLSKLLKTSKRIENSFFSSDLRETTSWNSSRWNFRRSSVRSDDYTRKTSIFKVKKKQKILSWSNFFFSKAKIYFQLGRCRKVTHSALSERELMNLIGVEQSTDLSMIRFWQKGLSQTYKNQIRLLKHNENVCSTNVHWKVVVSFSASLLIGSTSIWFRFVNKCFFETISKRIRR